MCQAEGSKDSREVTTPDTLMDLVRNLFPPNLIQATMQQYRYVKYKVSSTGTYCTKAAVQVCLDKVSSTYMHSTQSAVQVYTGLSQQYMYIQNKVSSTAIYSTELLVLACKVQKYRVRSTGTYSIKSVQVNTI